MTCDSFVAGHGFFRSVIFILYKKINKFLHFLEF